MAQVDVLTLGAEDVNGNWLNDIWGWTDPETDKEYALVGMTNGTSFVDISDPVNPVVLGVLREHNWNARTREEKIKERQNRVLHDGAKSIWRDIKTYGNYAYVVSEDPNHGIQVFDLTKLRDVSSPSSTNFFEEDGHYDGLGQAHNIFINEETGYLYAVGFEQSESVWTCNGGGLHIVDLSDPVNPVFAGCYDNDGYTHDTQCVVYQGPDSDYFGKEICFSSNEDTITLTEVEDKSAPSLISRTSYSGYEYVHQGWLTEDHMYFISDDELDEYYNGHNTRSYIWDVQDLDNPVLIGTYVHDTKSIDHNQYVKGNRVFQSNYTSGLRILNLYGIEDGELELDLYFDTYKSNDAASFYGTWSNYPYFESGLVVVSDITNGLFILDPVDLIIESQPQDINACEGDHLNFEQDINGDDIQFQWQYDLGDGNGFVDIVDFERYHSTQKMKLHAHEVSLEQSGTKYRCVMVDRGGVEYITDEITLTVSDTAEAEFSHVVGEDYAVTFTNASFAADSYSWDFGDGNSSSEENPSHTYSEPGTFDVVLTAISDCGEHEFSAEVNLGCIDAVADFSFSESAIYTISFQNDSEYSDNYSWDFGDGSNAVTDSDPVYTFPGAGTYDVVLSSFSSCSSDEVTKVVTVSEVLGALDDQTAIYPNPSNGRIRVDFGGPSGHLQIINLAGETLFSQVVSPSAQIDLGYLPGGVYLYEIQLEGRQMNGRIILR